MDVFRRFFQHVVDLCEDAGLIRGKEVRVDAAKVAGNESMYSLVLLEECRLYRNRASPSTYDRPSSRKISLTDPDGTAMSTRDSRTVLGYQDHYLVYGGKTRIVMHCLLTPGDVRGVTVRTSM